VSAHGRAHHGAHRGASAILGACALAISLGGCDEVPVADAGVPPDASIDASIDAAGDAGPDAGPALSADAGESRYAILDEEVVLDGSASTGATLYQWTFGDGTGWDTPRADAIATTRYATPGRYRAFLTVSDALGRRRVASVTIHVTLPLTHAPRQSGSVAVHAARAEVAVVSPDSDELAIFSYAGGAFSLSRRVATADEPRAVTAFGDGWAVACQAAGVVQVLGPGSGTPRAIPMPTASRPFGVIEVLGELFVSLQATGELVRIDAGLTIADRFFAIEDARGLALLPDGRIAVTRWRSPDARAEVAALSPDGASREVWALAYDPQPPSDTETGGVPSYLSSFLVSPTGRLGIVPSLQAAIGEGLYRSGRPLAHETTLRAALSFVDPVSGAEDFERRKLFDDRGLASAGAFSSHGDYVFVAMRGSRAVERFDVLTGTQAGSILEVGQSPQGLAISPDDSLLFVDAYLSRELVVYDVSNAGALPVELARLPIPSAEPLSAEILRGKVLFNDSADPRIGRDSYIACAHCHLDGLADHRTWDFTDRGEGLRDTIDLLGRAGIGNGPLHWSANFDEVQDFEHDMRGPFRGTGLMDDADFHSGTRDTTLGEPKAGVSADLDALAAYVTSLDAHLPSPYRNADGTLTVEATRGRAVFLAAGCPICHAGVALTDSGFESPGVPRLHDVGTLGAGSGQRLAGTLTGIDTPTLHGVWQSAPYLHDGSAVTLREVLTTRNPTDAHGTTSALGAGEIDDLLAYLRCLDGRVD
jgi:DNA-binding beta-propeller fold protein YncE